MSGRFPVALGDGTTVLHLAGGQYVSAPHADGSPGYALDRYVPPGMRARVLADLRAAGMEIPDDAEIEWH